MSEIMYHCSKPVFVHNLKNLSRILKLASRDAKARGIEPAVFLNGRLAPDMFTLTRFRCSRMTRPVLPSSTLA